MIMKIIDAKKDRDILKRIYTYEENIFFDAAVGKYNISPFSKYGRTYAIYDEKDIICVVETIFSLDKTAYLYGVSTNIKYRKQGYATKLLKYIIDDLKKENIKNIELTVGEENKEAIKLYKKLGFYNKEYLENEYFDNTNRLLMSKEL